MDTSPSAQPLSIIPATEADIPFIMSVERTLGYAALIGSFNADEHRRRFETTNTNYLLCHLGAEPVGFAVVRLDDDGMGNAQLHRIAMAQTGLGHGSAFLRQICRWSSLSTMSDGSGSTCSPLMCMRKMSTEESASSRKALCAKRFGSGRKP